MSILRWLGNGLLRILHGIGVALLLLAVLFMFYAGMGGVL